jgi:hypothetical protein
VHVVEGQHEYPGRCVSCGAARLYSGRYDAAFCPVEDEWQETRCGDKACPYCPGRPDRPSGAADLDIEDLDGD